MAIARENILGNNNAGASQSSIVITCSAGASVGSLVVVGVTWGAADRTTAVTDSKGNTYQQDRTVVSGSNMGRIFSGKVGTALVTSDTITVTWTGGTVNNPGASAIAYTGVKSASWFRAGNSGGATSNNLSSGTISGVTAGDLVYGIGYTQNNNTIAPGSGFTEIDDFSVQGTRRVQTQDQVVGSTGDLASTATATGSPIWIALGAAYEPEPGGGGPGGGEGELIGAVPI